MLRPSYSELMDAVMQEESLDPRVVSRYTLVLAAAKRARQITDGAAPLTYVATDRAVSIAVKELHEGKLKIKVEANLLDGNIERLLKQKERNRAISALSKDDLNEDLKDPYEIVDYDVYDVEDDIVDDLSFVPLADVGEKSEFVDIFEESLLDEHADVALGAEVEVDLEEEIDEV